MPDNIHSTARILLQLLHLLRCINLVLGAQRQIRLEQTRLKVPLATATIQLIVIDDDAVAELHVARVDDMEVLLLVQMICGS